MAVTESKPESGKTFNQLDKSENNRVATALWQDSQTDRSTPPKVDDKKADPVGQDGVIDFNKAADPYGEKTGAAPAEPPKGAQPSEQATSNALAGARFRAMLGLEQIAPDSQVRAVAQGFTTADMVEGLGLPADASKEEIKAAIDAKMRDNVGLPADATEEEYQQRLMEYNELAATDPVGAHNRAELALPPSATSEEVAEAAEREINADEKARMGLPQNATEAEVAEAYENYSPEAVRSAHGLPADASDEEVDAAVEAKVRENVGLPASATPTELSRRLAEYEELAKTDPDGAQLRAELGMAPSTSVDDMWDEYWNRYAH